MAYQTATNKGILAAPGGPISVGPITPANANSFAVVACPYFSTIAAYGSWSQPGGQGSILFQQFAGQPSITNTATITYSDGLNDEWAAVMAVYGTDATPPVLTVLTTGSFSFPGTYPRTVAVNQNDAILIWVGMGTSINTGNNGGDPGITITDSDNNNYTFVKVASGVPHDNVVYLFTAFNVNANAALTITITGGTPMPSSGPTGFSILTVTHLVNFTGSCFGSTML